MLTSAVVSSLREVPQKYCFVFIQIDIHFAFNDLKLLLKLCTSQLQAT